MGKYNIERISHQIRIGWDGENNWRPQTFDCSSLLATRPNGTVTLWILPNGEPEAFPVALTADGNLRTWTPLDSELVGGGGKLQFHCQSGTDIGKSPVYRYVVEDSVLTGADHPAETPSWAVQVVADVTEAAGHYPYIGENGNWFVWNSTEGEFVDTGVSAGGGSGGSGTVKSVNNVEPDASGNVALSIPSKTSDLQNDSGYLTQHQSLAAYRTSAAQDTIDAAQDQAIAAKYTKPSGGIPATDLAAGVIPSVPTAVSQLDNDSGYLTLAGLDYSGANTLLLSLSGATVTLDESFLHVYALLSDSARQNLFVLPIGGTELQPIALEFYPVHLDGQNYSITLACVYNGNRYSVTLDVASPNASSMTGTLVTEPIVMQSDIPTAVSQLANDRGYQTATDVQTAISPLQTKSITDTGGYFTTDTVDGALQEIGAELAGINTLIGSGVIS